MKPPSNIAPPLLFLYTDIGRGHPFYLDGIIEALERGAYPNPTRVKKSVFDLSHGFSRLAWCAVRRAYRHGSSGGIVGRFYTALRADTDYSKAGLFGRLLGRDLKKFLANTPGPLVVAHPLLVGLLAKRFRVIYQHGELVAPTESLILGAEAVLVPSDEVAATFAGAGYHKDRIFVSGLCVEPAIATQAKTCFAPRLARLSGDGPLTGLFLSSGAEPQNHVTQVISSVTSCLRAGHKVLVLARSGGRLERTVRSSWDRDGVIYRLLSTNGLWPKALGNVSLAIFQSRREENELAAKLFPEVDFLVGPAHERSNWAMGLGLPTFLPTPAIGPFAPLNRELLQRSGTARLIDHEAGPEALADTVAKLRASGELTAMARSGWGRSIDGFQRIAEFLAERFG